jgi:hypothetical protein
MKKINDFSAAIWVNTDEVTGMVYIDFEFAMHLQKGDTLRFYGDENDLAPWVEVMGCEGNLESIFTTEFVIVKRFFDADSLALFADEILEE